MTAEQVPPEEGFHAEFPLNKLVLQEDNVRSVLPDVTELADSIRAEGILEPLIAVPAGDGNAMLVAGFRRYHAAQQVGLTKVPVRLITADANRRRRVALIENLQRVDMNPLDKAIHITAMMENEFVEQKDVAKALGVSDGFVSQHLALLRLPKKIQVAVRNGDIELAHARQLTRVKDEEKALEFLALANTLTSASLSDKIDIYLQKEKERADKLAKNERLKAKASKRGKLGIKDVEEDAPPTMAEQYAAKKLEPLKKTDLQEALKFYANKYERSESEGKKAAYKNVLKGLEIAAGLLEFSS